MITAIYYGSRDAMIAECSVPDFYTGAFLVIPHGAGMYDAEEFDTLESAAAGAEYRARMESASDTPLPVICVD